MQSDIIIRDAAQSACKVSAARLLKKLHAIHAASRPDIYTEADDSVFERRAAEAASSPDFITLLAERGEEAVGIALVSLKDISNPLCNRRRVAFIEAIYVEEGERGHGIGSALYNAAAQRAKAAGSDSMELSVCTFNTAAFDFYMSMGMKSKCALLEMKL